MWKRSESAMHVDIQPAGEADRHIVGPECECVPRISKHYDGRVMIIHKTFDGAAGFEVVGEIEERKVA
jgi:hypothetical protein